MCCPGPATPPGRKCDITPASLSAQSLGRKRWPSSVTPWIINCCTSIIFKKRSLAIKTVREQRYTKDRIVYDSVWRHRQFAGLYERNNRYIPAPEHAHSLSTQAPDVSPTGCRRKPYFFSCL